MRTAAPDATTPQGLAELTLPAGSWSAEVILPDLPADAYWTDAAIAPDGSRLVVAMLDEPTRVLERSTGEVLAELSLYGMTPWGFAGPDEVRLGTGAAGPQGNLSRPPAPSGRSTASSGRGSAGAEARPLFHQGVSWALSPDGALLAQHVRTRADTGVVAVRLSSAAAPGTEGELLVAPLGAWLPEGQLVPRLSFSPSGSHLAGLFDSAPVWGRATSALLVWDVETRELVRRVPTRRDRWDNLVWREEAREVAVSRFDPRGRRGEVAVVEY